MAAAVVALATLASCQQRIEQPRHKIANDLRLELEGPTEGGSLVTARVDLPPGTLNSGVNADFGKVDNDGMFVRSHMLVAEEAGPSPAGAYPVDAKLPKIPHLGIDASAERTFRLPRLGRGRYAIRLKMGPFGVSDREVFASTVFDMD